MLWWKLFLRQLVMMFEGFGTTFVYVVVWKLSLLGGVSCRFFRFYL